MKNSIKILTLGLFVLAGLTFRTFVFAKDYTQSNTGYINNSTNSTGNVIDGLNAYWPSSGKLQSITYPVFPFGSYYIGAFSSGYMAEFTNRTNLNDKKWCGGSTGDIPLSWNGNIHDITVDMTGCNLDFSVYYLDYISGPWSNVSGSYGVDPVLGVPDFGKGITADVNGYAVGFKLTTDEPTFYPLDVYFPTASSTVLAINPITMTGHCPVPFDVVKVSPELSWQVPKNQDGTYQWIDENGNPLYSATCDANGLWSYKVQPSYGWQKWYVMSEDYLDNPTTTNYTSIDFQGVQDIRELNNYITVIYPRDDTGHYYFKVQPDPNYPVKFQYSNFKDYLDTNATSTVYKIRFSDCTDLSFNSCTPFETDNLTDLDSDNLGTFVHTFNVPTSTAKYYSLNLLTSEDDFTSSKFVLNFTLYGDSTSEQGPVVPGQRCTNVLCDLFIPRSDFISSRLDSLKNGFYYRKPFSYLNYFMALITSYNSHLVTCDGNTPNYLLDMDYSVADVHLPILGMDTCEKNFRDIWSYVLPVMRYALYIMLFMYFIHKARGFFHRPTA